MTKNKIGMILTILMVFILTLNATFAAEIFDNKSITGVYKVSEDESSFDIPFFRISGDRIEIDKPISQVGFFMSNSSIEVTEPLEGVQILYGNDTVRINSSAQYPIIFTTGNVVINGEIENTTFIYCNGTITLGEDANIKGNLICYAPKLEVNGQIDGNILGNATILDINGTVKGKLRMQVQELNCSENAIVENEMQLTTTNAQLTVPENVGNATIDVISGDDFQIGQYILGILLATISNVVIFLLLLIVFKKEKLAKVAENLTNGRKVLKNGISAFVGILIALCFGIVLLALITNLGVALIVFAVAVMIIFTLLKNVIFGVFVVELVNNRYSEGKIKPNNILTAIVVFLMLELLQTIPYVGEVIKFIVYIVSLGIIYSLIKKDKVEEVNDDKQEVIEAK